MENQSGKNGWTNFGKVLVLSLSFMLLMAAWLTTSAIEQTVLQSVRDDDPTFNGNGYVSQAIVNGVFALTNIIAPTIVSIIGVRTSLFGGGFLYILFISSFLYPNSWFLYGTSILVGFGAAPLWVANGNYLTSCSTKDTIGKYMGIYWAIQASGQIFGNAFVFWQFQGLSHIDQATRILVTSVLMSLAVLGSITLLFLGNPIVVSENQTDENAERESIRTSIRKLFRLFMNKHMLLLIPTSMYNGMEFAFFSAIYPTSMSFTEAFGNNTRNLVAVAGLLLGTGALFGALLSSFVIERFIKSKRNFIVTTCFVAHCVSFLLMYINLPNQAPLGPTCSKSFLNPPSIPVAMICAFLLGMGDGFLSPQMCAAIGVIWPEDPSSAYAIYRFFLATTCAAAYFTSTLTGLYYQILIFLGLATVGTFCFHLNEKLIAKMHDNLESENPSA